MKNAIETRRFEQPDDALNMQEFGGISIIKMADGTTGMHAIFEPGWTWEKDEKPLLGHPASCPMSHTGYCLGGNLVVRMVDTNVETRISKGDFVDPGFVPAARTKHSCVTPKPVPIEFVQPLVVDTRPIFARGDTPCKAIDEAVASLIAGQLLVLVVDFEPARLYAKLANQGFSHTAKQLSDGAWRVEFRKKQ